MVKKLLGILLMAGILAAVVFLTRGAEPAGLILTFAPPAAGQYHVTVTADQDIVQTVDGNDLPVQQTIGFEYDMDIDRTDEDGSIWIDVTYDRFWLDQTNVQGEMHYDSADPAGELPSGAQALSMLLGKSFALQVSSTGRTLAIAGVDELIDQMLMTLSISDESQLAYARQQLESQFGDEALLEQLEGVFMPFPTGRIQIGDTWTSSSATGGTMPLLIENTYTLQAYGDGRATLQASSTIVSDPAAGPVNMLTYVMDYDVSGTQSGTVEIDTATGWATSALINQHLEGQATLTAGEEQVIVPLTMDTVTALAVEPVAP